MSIKIEYLPELPSVKLDGYTVLTQSVTPSNRTTFKTSISALKEYTNSNIENRINILINEIKNKNLYITYLERLLKKDGSRKMSGDLNFGNKKLLQYTANIINVNDNYILESINNSSLILVNKPNPNKNPDEVVNITIKENTLPVGFNSLFIQTGDTNIKFITDGSVELWNPDNIFKSKSIYSFINLCVLKQNKVWIFGDMASN